MGRQIRFYLCPEMRTAIESEAQRTGARLVDNYSTDPETIQFSTSSGTDAQKGRLWTEAADPTHYEALCRAVKKGAFHDREPGLWVKRASRAAYEAYRAEKERDLAELVERNRKYAIEVLGGKVTTGEDTPSAAGTEKAE